MFVQNLILCIEILRILLWLEYKILKMYVVVQKNRKIQRFGLQTINNIRNKLLFIYFFLLLLKITEKYF